MAIAVGTRLGPYEILSSLGAGGMGEVYRARDTRLDRIVAIKVLSSRFAGSEHRRRRLQREARAISSLNHPHVASLYDVGSDDGADFLVMELVEGETLSERLKKGALLLEDAFRYGVQIADALDQAHRQGIVHRDLKPSNVMLTKAGVKLIDLGLAKFDERKTGVLANSSAPTAARKLTEEGAIVGTLQYMAPEQLEGKDVDARADLFALGTILYEMVTGRPAFEGKSPASLIAAILDHDPGPVSDLQATASPGLDHAIARCLKKDRDERWQSALDLRNELEWVATSAPEPSSPWVFRKRTRLVPATIAIAALIGGLAAGVYLAPNVTRREPVITADISLGTGRFTSLQAYPVVYTPAVAISPDGSHVAYVGEHGDVTGIYLRPIDQPTAKWVDGTEGAFGPFFSPDNTWLGFASEREPGLWKVLVAGGAPVQIVQATSVRGASWSNDGYVYFTPTPNAGIWRVPASGGEAEELTTPEFDLREKTHRFPEVLPNGKGLLLTVGSADIDTFGDARIEVFSLATGERRILVEGGMNARYLRTGHILYARSGSLFAVPFDVDRLEVTGTPVAVLKNVSTSPQYGPGHFAVSENGLLVYAPGGPRTRRTRLVWVNRQGKAEPLSDATRNYWHPRISPDGSRVAVEADEANVSLWVHELDRGTWTRLVSGWDNSAAIWGPSGNYVAFASNRAGTYDLYRKAIDGSRPAERLSNTEHAQFPTSWSPDGSTLAFSAFPEADIWALPKGDEEQAPYPLLDTRARETTGEISPDGRWLAYVSDDSGRQEVYVQRFPHSGARIPVSTEGGTEPAWSPSGKELYYRKEDEMMVVAFEAGAMAQPRMLFDASEYKSDDGARNYDITPDGRRFLMVEGSETEPPPDHLTLVVNWFEELQKRFSGNRRSFER